MTAMRWSFPGPTVTSRPFDDDPTQVLAVEGLSAFVSEPFNLCSRKLVLVPATQERLEEFEASMATADGDGRLKMIKTKGS